MARYDYQCTPCNKTIEVSHSMTEKKKVSCPDCGKDMVKQMGNFGGFTFKGPGFYATDYKRYQ